MPVFYPKRRSLATAKRPHPHRYSARPYPYQRTTSHPVKTISVSCERLSSLSRINAFVIVRIIKDRDHANKPVGGLEQDIVFPNKQSGFEPFNHASDAEGFPAVALVGGGRISFELLHQFGGIHNFVRLQWRP